MARARASHDSERANVRMSLHELERLHLHDSESMSLCMTRKGFLCMTRKRCDCMTRLHDSDTGVGLYDLVWRDLDGYVT